MLVRLILICFFTNFPYADGQKGFKIKFTNFICDGNPEWVGNISCKIKAINWKTNAIDASLDTVKPLRNMITHIQVFIRYSGYRPFLFNFTTNLCNVFGGIYKSLILRSIGPIIKKYTNAHKCPMEGHFYAHCLKADVFDFRSIWPNDNYRLNLKMYSDNFRNKIIDVTIFLTVVED